MILHIESPIANICASHAFVRKLTMIQEDRACKARDNVDIRRPRSVTCRAFNGAVQITARSSPMHGLERRLVRFLRLHRATLCCADFRVCYPRAADRIPLGSVGRTRAFVAIWSMGTGVDRQRLIRPQPHSRHSSQHPCFIMGGLSQAIVGPSGRSAAHTPYRSLARTQSFQ